MKSSRWSGRVAALIAVFAFLLGGVGAAAAQDAGRSPTPVPHPIAPTGEAPQSPEAGNVTAYDAWTGDGNWNYKDWFFPGEVIEYVVTVNNTTGNDRDITLEYEVFGPDGELVDGGAAWTYNLTTGPGIMSWGIQWVVPAGHGGWHQLVGSVTYQGNTTQAGSSGHNVYGSTAGNYLFADGFEWTPDLSNWSARKTDNGDLYVTPDATLVGWNGLAVVIDDKKPLYLTDETPWSEWTYSAAFFFDPNSIVMKNGNVHNIFVERNEANRPINIVQFRRLGADYQLRFQTRKDGGGFINTPWQTISDGPHRLTIGWSSSIWPGYNNGTYTFGIQKYPYDGTEWWWFKYDIDNDTSRIDSVLLGPSSGIDKQTKGTYYFDGFDSWR